MSAEPQSLARRVAASAGFLTGRRAVTMLLFAASTAASARFLGPSDFGGLASAIAAFQLALATTDVGFSLVLGRELARRPDEQGRILRAAVQVQTVWGFALALVLAGLGLASGLDTARGLAMVLLAPGVAVSGLGATRQLFVATFRTKQLALVDVPANLIQSALIIAVAAAGGGVAGIALVMTAGTIATVLIVVRLARPLIEPGRPERADRTSFIRQALPVGVASVLSSFYFSIDLVLLGWLVSGDDLGHYAAAVKILSLLVTLPALVMTAALPGFSLTAESREELSALAARVWHWLAAIGLPLCVAVAVFADPLVSIVFGSGYDDSVPLVRIVAVTASVALFGNLLGSVLVARSMSRQLVLQNLAALALNVGAILVLVPRYGITAAAWSTLATELFVTLASAIALRHHLSLTRALPAVSRPGVAVVGLALTGVALASWPALAIPAAAGVFVALTLALGAWPDELRRLPSKGASA